MNSEKVFPYTPDESKRIMAVSEKIAIELMEVYSLDYAKERDGKPNGTRFEKTSDTTMILEYQGSPFYVNADTHAFQTPSGRPSPEDFRSATIWEYYESCLRGDTASLVPKSFYDTLEYPENDEDVWDAADRMVALIEVNNGEVAPEIVAADISTVSLYSYTEYQQR